MFSSQLLRVVLAIGINDLHNSNVNFTSPDDDHSAESCVKREGEAYR